MAAWEKCQHGIKAPLVIAMYFFSMLVAANSLRCYQCVGMFHECVQAEQLCTPRDRSCFASTIKLFYKNNYTEVFMLPGLFQMTAVHTTHPVHPSLSLEIFTFSRLQCVSSSNMQISFSLPPNQLTLLSNLHNRRIYLEIAEYVMKGCSGEGVSNRTANVYSEDDQEVHNAYYCDSDLCNIRFTGAPASSPQVANGMECYSCFDRGTGECAPGNATRIKCLGDMNQCMDFTVINGAWKMTYRTCALETLCRRQYVLPDLSGRLDISCCSTPLCNDGRPGLKSLCSHFSEQGIKRKPENGLECASCCDSGLGECAPGNWTHVKCVGDQNMCVNVTEGGQTLLRSCSLEKLCRERPQLLGLGKNASIRCCSGSLCNHSMTPAAGTARMHLLLPAVLMMMWLL